MKELQSWLSKTLSTKKCKGKCWKSKSNRHRWRPITNKKRRSSLREENNLKIRLLKVKD